MRVPIWVTMTVSFAGMQVPIWLLLNDAGWSVFGIGLVGVAISPLVAVMLAAWYLKSNPLQSWSVVGIALAMIMTGVAGWLWGAQDPKGINLFLMLVFGVPAAQMFLLGAGLAVAWWLYGTPAERVPRVRTRSGDELRS